MSPLETLDLMLRGAAAGVSLILAVTLLRLSLHSLNARLGALFALGAASYAVASAPAIATSLPGLVAILKPGAMLTGVLFWWFTLALFCDLKRWSRWRLAPALIVLACYAPILFEAAPALMRAGYVIGELVNGALMIHVIVIIANGLEDDLVEPRREFRTLWIGAIAFTVLAIVAAELWKLYASLPSFMHIVEAGALFIVSCGIAAWSLSVQSEFFPDELTPGPQAQRRTEPQVEAADTYLAAQLRGAMDAGLYRTPGLTVGALADRLQTQEHRLRAVINQQLGYRNFAAFLNEYRVSAAKTALADPTQARRQVLQIALDLGYGSIAPFNRAFREATGATPTGYRRAMLSGERLAPAAAE